MGVFGAAVGLRGEIRVKSYTEDPASIVGYSPLLTGDGRSLTLTLVREQNDMIVVRVEGVTSRQAAEALTNISLHVPRARLGATEADEFFHADLIGLAAVTPSGEPLGTVVAVHDFGAGDMIEVASPRGRTQVFPFTKAVVPVVDLAAGRIVIDPPAEIDGDAP